MLDSWERTRLLLGDEALERLSRSRVAVFGIGGVGGYVVEALARSGVGALDLIDSDRIAASNLNRQILATRATLGQYKVDAARERIASIHPSCTVRTYMTFFLPETAKEFEFSEFASVVDAIDTVTGKIQLILSAKAAGTPIISSMGTGNKLDPAAFRVADIYDTSVCPLARIMRKELRRRGVEGVKVVYSTEPPRQVSVAAEALERAGRRSIPGSVSFVPATAGLIIAGEVIRDLTGITPKGEETI